MATSRVESDLHVGGRLSAQSMTLPTGTVIDASIPAGANVSSDKLQHRHRCVFNQVHGSVAVTERRPVFWALSVGTIRRIKVGSVVVNVGAATITVDIRKNGTTILTAIVTLDSGNTVYIAEDGTMTSAALVAGDVLEVVVVATAGGGTLGQGLFVVIDVDEDAV